MQNRLVTSLMLFLFCQYLICQSSELDDFDLHLKSTLDFYKKDELFYKTSKFYLQKNFDSTLINSLKYISKNGSNQEKLDYCHYFRANSFIEKKIYREALNELNKINLKFKFYHKVFEKKANIYLFQNEYKKANIYYKKIEKDYNLPNKNRANIYLNMGVSNLHLKEYGEAEKCFLKILNDKKFQQDKLVLVNVYSNLANLYYEQYKDDLAIPYFEKAYELSKYIDKFEIKEIAAKNMSSVEENNGNFEKALQYLKESASWKDSINDQNKIWTVANLEKKFALKEKQKQIKILEIENKIKQTERNNFIYTSVLFLILFLIGLYALRQKIISNRIIVQQNKKLDELNLMKNKLFAIVSHDLRSSVNALKVSNSKLLQLLENRNYEQLDHLLHKNSTIVNSSYNLLDNLLNWALQQTDQAYFKKEYISLKAIVNQVEYNYKPLLFEKNLTLDIDIDPSVMISFDIDSLKIIVRNLLDNAIKFSNKNGNIKIYTKTNNDPDKCVLVIQDFGVGFSKEKLDELKNNNRVKHKENNNLIGSGLGLQLCYSLSDKNGSEINIESEPNKGTQIYLILSTKNTNE